MAIEDATAAANAILDDCEMIVRLAAISDAEEYAASCDRVGDDFRFRFAEAAQSIYRHRDQRRLVLETASGQISLAHQYVGPFVSNGFKSVNAHQACVELMDRTHNVLKTGLDLGCIARQDILPEPTATPPLLMFCVHIGSIARCATVTWPDLRELRIGVTLERKFIQPTSLRAKQSKPSPRNSLRDEAWFRQFKGGKSYKEIAKEHRVKSGAKTKEETVRKAIARLRKRNLNRNKDFE